MSSMRESQLRYTFHPVHRCNMCGAENDTHRVLGKRLNRSQGKDPWNRPGVSTTVMRCTVCGLVFSNPQPVPVDISDHYGVPPESYWKPEYFEDKPDYFKGELGILKTLLPISEGMRSLDIGAGLGKSMIALQRAGFDAYGFEPSEQFRERAVSRMGIDPQKLKPGMIEEMEYPENSFDFITFGAVLEHLYDPSAAIVKAMRWLRPGGIVHIEVPSSAWLVNRLVNLYYRLRGSDYVANLSPMHEPYHLYEFGLRSFTMHAQQHGYQVARHDYYICKTYLPRILDPLLVPYMKMTDTGMQLCVWLRKA